jgi:hypothetical protein
MRKGDQSDLVPWVPTDLARLLPFFTVKNGHEDSESRAFMVK